jgi:uncharacterized membrane protein
MTQKLISRAAGLIAGCGLAAAAAGQSLPTRYEFVALDALGGPWSNGLAINNAGVVAGLADLPNRVSAPFIYRNGQIEMVPGLHPSNQGSAFDVSDAGQVVGYSHAPLVSFPGTVSHAFYWSAETGAVDLEPNTDAGSMARAINGLGQIVGEAGGGSTFGLRMWTVDRNGQVTRTVIPFPGPAGFSREANDIDDSGHVVGGGWVSEPIWSYAAYIFKGFDEPITLLPTLGGRDASASSIAGPRIVGWSQPAEGFQRACLWQAIPGTDPVQYEVIDLGILGGDHDGGEAWAINRDGVIVGADQAFGANGVPPKPWVWVNGAKVPLETLLDPAVREVWTLWWATDINDAGQITGIAVRNPDSEFPDGDTAAFVLTPIFETIRCSPADVAGAGETGTEPDGIVDGSDFIAFINSFAIGDASIDALADIAGAGELGDEPDGTIDGTDFIAFINAFAIGC